MKKLCFFIGFFYDFLLKKYICARWKRTKSIFRRNLTASPRCDFPPCLGPKETVLTGLPPLWVVNAPSMLITYGNSYLIYSSLRNLIMKPMTSI